MAWMQCALFVFILVQVATCNPHKKRAPTKKVIRPCVQVSAALGEVLGHADTFMRLRPGAFQNLLGAISTIDVYDASVRENLICGFEGLGTLSELLEAAEDIGLDYTIVKAAYAYMSVAVRFEKLYMQQALDNNYEWGSSVSTSRKLDLIEDLEAFGILGLDPTAEAVVTETMHSYGLNDIETEPLSSLPVEAQCSQLTNSIRKVWNVEIKRSSKYNPDASEEARAEVTRWTGIVITDHEGVKAMVCDLLGKAHASGLDGLYNWIKDMMILRSALKTAYPYLQEGFEYAQRDLDRSMGEQHPNIPYDYYSASYEGGKRIRRTSDPYNNYGNEIPYVYPGNGNGGPGYGGPGYGGPGYGGPGYGGPGYGGPGYGGPGYGGPGYGGPGYGNYQYPSQEEMLELYRNLEIILDNIELMGLISLTDDLRK